MPKGRGIRAAQAEATRQLLIDSAQALFREKGFAATSTVEIVARAGVTRGALQHHFSSKEELFKTIFEKEASTIVASAAERVARDGWKGFLASTDDYIRNVASHETNRISFVDGPAVLGWAQWRKLQIDHGLSMIEVAIADGISSGEIAPMPPRALAYLIRAIVEEASLMTLNAEALEIAPEDVENAVMALFSNLKADVDRPGARSKGPAATK